MSDQPPGEDWLVVIDAQAIFADPSTSPWGSPMWSDVEPRVAELCDQAERVVFTRFVAPAQPRGSWVPYYADFSFAQVPDDNPLYAIVPALAARAEAAQTVTAPTFGKWDAALRAVVGETPQLTLAGVSTDCCVLSTALAAADGGATVRVAAAACAGSTAQNHQRALDAMALYAPQITVG